MGVVVAAQMLPLNEHVRHGALTAYLNKGGLYLGSVVHVIELEHFGVYAPLAQQILRPCAVGAV